jgi:hypothetical protein
MIFLLWLASWFVQLHFLDASPWVSVSWPLFVVLTLFLSRRFITVRLIWWLLLLGIISDTSSHLAPGLVLRGYLFLAVSVVLMRRLDNKKYFEKKYVEAVAVIVLSGLVLLVQASSFKVLIGTLGIEIWLYLAMTLVIYFLIRLLVKIRSNLWL